MSDFLNISSGSKKTYKKAFKLDQDTLHRIAGILSKYAEELEHPATVVFHISRSDKRYYETTDIQNVLDDPNLHKKDIKYLSVDIRNADPNRFPYFNQSSRIYPWEPDFIARVNFRRDRKVTVGIWIDARDRKWALLLADELEVQIERTFKCTQVPNWLALLFYFSIGITITIWLPKLLGFNYVFDVLLNTIALFIWPGIFALSYATYVGNRPDWLARIFGPESIFLWGDESIEYLKREKARANILWGVAVAFVVSIGANIATALLMSLR